MKDETEVLYRIKEFREKIRLIEDRRNKELSKPFRERDDRLLRFLDREYNVYEFSLIQFEWVLSI
jgi:hypothetical protein